MSENPVGNCFSKEDSPYESLLGKIHKDSTKRHILRWTFTSIFVASPIFFILLGVGYLIVFSTSFHYDKVRLPPPWAIFDFIVFLELPVFNINTLSRWGHLVLGGSDIELCEICRTFARRRRKLLWFCLFLHHSCENIFFWAAFRKAQCVSKENKSIPSTSDAIKKEASWKADWMKPYIPK